MIGDRSFRVIAFDWDGTAVGRRDEDAGPLCLVLSRLLEADVLIAVITGTNRSHLDRQLLPGVATAFRRGLYLFTDRGSEVWGFDERGNPRALWRRLATPAEESLLTEIAGKVRDELSKRTGLTIGLVLDRLNRRKIDLIPLPEWRDPAKAQQPALIQAVQERLRGAGLTGGLVEAIGLAERISRESGLRGARITSDAKHVEIGLTDKGDAARWIVRELAGRHGIARHGVLFVGDEFTLVPGVPGSDARMRTAQTAGAVFVSVGPEPSGTPEWVIHLPGGPPRFQLLLTSQANRREPARADTASDRSGIRHHD